MWMCARGDSLSHTHHTHTLIHSLTNMHVRTIYTFTCALAHSHTLWQIIFQVLSGPGARDHHGYDAAVVLTVLANYRKYEAANPYVIKLSVLDDEIALNVSPAVKCTRCIATSLHASFQLLWLYPFNSMQPSNSSSSKEVAKGVCTCTSSLGHLFS